MCALKDKKCILVITFFQLKILFVTIVEIYTLILDVYECLK